MNLFSRKPTFDSADAKLLVESSAKQIESTIGQPVYVTASGILTERWLSTQTEKFLSEATEQTSVDLIALKFDLNRAVIEKLLPSLSIYPQLYIDGPTIFTVPLVRQYEEGITELLRSKVMSILECCRELGITVRFLQWLARKDKVALVGDYAMLRSTLEDAKGVIESAVSTAQEPLNVADLQPQLCDILMSQLPLNGFYDKSSKIYTPKVWREKLKDQLRKRLESDGFVSDADLKAHGFDKGKFTREGYTAVSGGLVSKSVVESEKANAKRLLDGGYFIVSNTKYPELIPSFELKAVEMGDVMVKQSFLNRIKSELEGKCAEEGKKDAEQKIAASPPHSSDDPRRLVNSLTVPNTSQMQSWVDYELPDKSLKAVVSQNAVTSREAYIQAASGVFKKAIADAQAEVEAKLTAYLHGVLSCPEPLRDVLFEEWQEYAKENDNGVQIGTVKQAQTIYTSDSALVANAVHQIVRIAHRKLMKTKDAATVLHSAVVIWHAVKLSNYQAALKCRGKQIPKILKAFEFPENFTVLKNQVTKKESSLETIETLRSELKDLV